MGRFGAQQPFSSPSALLPMLTDMSEQHTFVTRQAVLLFGVGALVVGADQISKLATSESVCGPFVCPLRNDELMLGIGGKPTVHAAVVGFIAVAVFAIWVVVARRVASVPPIGVALFAAGIVSNLFDRVALGSVRDFVVVPANAVINLADVAIVLGSCICVVGSFRSLLSPTPRGGESK